MSNGLEGAVGGGVQGSHMGDNAGNWKVRAANLDIEELQRSEAAQNRRPLTPTPLPPINALWETPETSGVATEAQDEAARPLPSRSRRTEARFMRAK